MLNLEIGRVNDLFNPEITALADAYNDNYLMWKDDFHKANPGVIIRQGSQFINFTDEESEYWKIMDIEPDIVKQDFIYANWGYAEFYDRYILWLAKNYKQYVRAKQ